jgi:TorA maturation chaperone TorD
MRHETESIERCAELAAFARLLSLGFGAPDGETLDETGAIARGLGGRSGSRDAVAALVGALDGASTAELAREFVALFDGEARCPPYEGSYEADPFRHARQMADVAGFYRAFGAEVSGERPDHAGAELEFLSCLAARRVVALVAGEEEAAEVCRKAEDSFLLDHLGRWFPSFCRRVAAETSSPFYAELARLGERVVRRELACRGLVPAPLPRRRRFAVEADVVECAGAAEPI